MKETKDYIIFALDLPTAKEAKKYVDLLGKEVGMFKVGLELFVSEGPEFIKYILNNTNAEVFLDLKLHDIPTTVFRTVKNIAKLGVTFTTVHCSTTGESLKAAVQASDGKVGILGVTVLTSLADYDVVDSTDKFMSVVLERAKMAKKANCAGVICSGHEAETIKNHVGLMAITPGIRPMWCIEEKNEHRRVMTPSKAIEQGAEYLVIGRPIRDAKDPKKAVEKTIKEIDDYFMKKNKTL